MRRLAAAVAAAMLVIACGPDSKVVPAASATPTAGPTAIGTATATPTAAPTACRLPVLLPQPLADAASHKDFTTGWLDTASGTVTVAGTMPVGDMPPSYDAAMERWVPAPRALVSPDGSAYAYVEDAGMDPSQRYSNTRIHVVDVASGADRVLVPAGHYHVAGWVTAGILLFPLVQGGPERGLWLAEPATGALRQVDVAQPRVYWSAAGNLAWYGDLDRSDPNAPEGPGAANVLVSLDPATGSETTWLREFGSSVAIMGAAPGGPMVARAQDSAGRVRVLLVSTPGNDGHELWAGIASAYSGDLGLNEPVFDSSYIWFAGAVTPGGIPLYRYTQRTGALEMLPVKIGLLGGGCVGD